MTDPVEEAKAKLAAKAAEARERLRAAGRPVPGEKPQPVAAAITPARHWQEQAEDEEDET